MNPLLRRSVFALVLLIALVVSIFLFRPAADLPYEPLAESFYVENNARLSNESPWGSFDPECAESLDLDPLLVPIPCTDMQGRLLRGTIINETTGEMISLDGRYMRNYSQFLLTDAVFPSEKDAQAHAETIIASFEANAQAYPSLRVLTENVSSMLRSGDPTYAFYGRYGHTERVWRDANMTVFRHLLVVHEGPYVLTYQEVSPQQNVQFSLSRTLSPSNEWFIESET